MGGNIQGLRLQRLGEEIRDYMKLSSKMATSFSDIYNCIKRLQGYWTGKRVNQVISVWNNNFDTMNDNILYFCDTMIDILYDVFWKYCKLERIDAGLPAYKNTITIQKVKLTDESNITFFEQYVDGIFDEFDRGTLAIKSDLDQLTTELSDIAVYSDSLRGLVERYEKVAIPKGKSLDTTCETIRTEFKKAIDDVKTTERYNLEDAERAGSIPQRGSSSSGSAGGNGSFAGGHSGSGSHVESSGSQGGTGSGRGSSSGRTHSGRGSSSSGGGTNPGTVPDPTPKPTPSAPTPEPAPSAPTPEPEPSAPAPEPMPPEPEPAPPEPPLEPTPEPAPPEPPLKPTPEQPPNYESGGSYGSGTAGGGSTPQGGSPGSGSVNSEDPYSNWDHIIPPDGSPWYPGWTGKPKS